jgi:hypothetical protein
MCAFVHMLHRAAQVAEVLRLLRRAAKCGLAALFDVLCLVLFQQYL